MSVLVRIDGKPFQYFTQLNVSKDLDNMSSDGQITVSEPMDDLSIIKLNSKVNIYLDGFQVLGGYQEDTKDKENEDNHDITYKVRDSVQDLIDSSVPQIVRVPQQFTDFSQVLNAVLQGNSLTDYIGIDNQRGALPLPYDSSGIPIVKAAEMGTKCGDYLTECARIVSCIMNTSYNKNGSINILLRNFSNNDKLKTMLLWQENGLNNNILDGDLDIDWTERYGIVKVWSNGNIGMYEQDPATGLGVYSGTATDNEIRNTRILELYPQVPLASNELCQMRAREEVNLRRTRSFKYSVRVQGFSANGELWDIGKLARVQDDKRRVKGWLLIKAVEYEYTEGGAITTLTLTYPDAYGVTLNNDASNQQDPNSTSMAVSYIPVSNAQNWKVSKGAKTIASQSTR